MKLYDCPRNSKIKWINPETKEEYTINFHHIDGMFSLCFYDNQPFHLSASAEVELVNDFRS